MAFNWFGGIFIIFFNILRKFTKAVRKFSLLAGGGRGAGGYKKKINTGRLCLEVRLLTLLYTVFGRKDNPIRIPSIDKIMEPISQAY